MFNIQGGVVSQSSITGFEHEIAEEYISRKGDLSEFQSSAEIVKSIKAPLPDFPEEKKERIPDGQTPPEQQTFFQKYVH